MNQYYKNAPHGGAFFETAQKGQGPFWAKGLQSAARIICPLMADKFHTCRLIPKPVKKLEKLFIAPKVRQVLYETSQRVFTRCACAQRTGFLIKFFIKNQYEKYFLPGTRPGKKWITFDLPPAGGKLCEAFLG